MVAAWMLLFAMVLCIAARPSVVLAQDDTAATTAPAADGAEADGSEADESETDEATADESPAEEPSNDEPAGEEPVEEAPAGDQTAAANTAATGAAAAPTSEGISPYLMAAILIALFVIPGFIGSSLGKNLGMPDHGWKIATAIGTIAAAILAIVFAMGRDDGFKLGPDLGGGVTLIYDLEDPDLVQEDDDTAGPEFEEAEGGNRRKNVNMDDMLAALKERVDPSGTKEVTIRSRGKAIEFIIPKAGQAELNYIKKKITDLGQLEFRILVDSTRSEFENVIKKALAMPPGQTIVKIGGVEEARWVPYDTKEFDTDDNPRNDIVVKRMGVQSPEILVKIDAFNVTGEYVTNAAKGIGPDGHEVKFFFDSQGSNRFGKLTGRHTPNPKAYFLGIILDGQLRSAPSIKSRITGQGTISGRMTEEEVTHIVDILNAGSLPAALNKTPVSEAQTGPEIGELTIRQGKRAMITSLALVLAFILAYYRFAGLVACLALVANIALVLGAMVLLNAAFTLPGLAGLVLTVGMSVDANVLIFERIREEIARGATLRMAIRNGFGRATTTIVDANVTTLITGLVLYVIGTDQIKGFAVTLILGILMSMYTAIFCSRILFDIAERRGWISKLGMMHLLTRTNIDFLSKWPVAAALSLAVIVTGLFGVASRQSNLLNIDFTGGTSVTMVLKDDHAMDIAEVRDTLLETELADKNLLVVGRNQTDSADTTYKIDTNMLDELDEQGRPVQNAVERVEEILAEAFAGKLETYTLNISPLQDFVEGEEGENQYRGVETTISFGDPDADESVVGVTYDTIFGEVKTALDSIGQDGIRPVVTNPLYTDGSSRRLRDWNVRFEGLEESEAQRALDAIQQNIAGEPIFPLANKIGSRIAGDMQTQAIYAIAVSLLGIVGYIWIRFQKISYGLAAVVALVHDVLVTLGVIALSAYVVSYVPALADALQIEAFQISLPIVAAFLTIIGYSLNDTIVVFDRIREVRGKSPNLSAEMINTSVNQTLSRTILTSLTTLIVVAILYFFGGDGIHSFAFALVVGVIVGTYSSIFVASPALLWLAKLEQDWSA